MTTSEQEGCTTEMVFMADIAAQQLIFQVKKEALRQFQNRLIAMRKEKKPNTNVFAIRALLLACRRERSWMNIALDLIEYSEQLIGEVHRVSAIAELRMQKEAIK